MNKGNHAVSIALSTFVVFMAADAGRDHEGATGALRAAPGLAADPKGGDSVHTCSQPAAQRAELVFEMLDPDDVDTDLPRQLAAGAREVVAFEWNEATGELTFSTSAASTVFSDLQFPASQASVRSHWSCG